MCIPMRGLPYFEEIEYHQYLLSGERRELFPPDVILSQIRWHKVEDLLDFGMGNGYFLSHFYKFIGPDTKIWGAESQEVLIDYCLQLKVKEQFNNFIPFFIERTEHPLLPDWIPPMDIIFCSCVLSTFANPSLAIRGIGRGLSPSGRIIIIDWEKKNAPSGPEIAQKVSLERMQYFIEDAGYRINRRLKINPFVMGLEVVRDPEKEEEPVYTPQNIY